MTGADGVNSVNASGGGFLPTTTNKGRTTSLSKDYRPRHVTNLSGAAHNISVMEGGRSSIAS